MKLTKLLPIVEHSSQLFDYATLDCCLFGRSKTLLHQWHGELWDPILVTGELLRMRDTGQTHFDELPFRLIPIAVDLRVDAYVCIRNDAGLRGLMPRLYVWGLALGIGRARRLTRQKT
jgi:hypothetical protein